MERSLVWGNGICFDFIMQSESAVHDPKFEARKNIVLMGDSLGDLHMAEGIPNPNVILKIGFLNKNTEENLIKYKVGADG
jgi:hypothetical protein